MFGGYKFQDWGSESTVGEKQTCLQEKGPLKCLTRAPVQFFVETLPEADEGFTQRLLCSSASSVFRTVWYVRARSSLHSSLEPLNLKL